MICVFSILQRMKFNQDSNMALPFKDLNMCPVFAGKKLKISPQNGFFHKSCFECYITVTNIFILHKSSITCAVT